MSRKRREKESAKRDLMNRKVSEKARNVPKEIVRRGFADGTEKLRGQIRDRKDETQRNPENEATERVEGSARQGAVLAGRSIEAFLKKKKREQEEKRTVESNADHRRCGRP